MHILSKIKSSVRAIKQITILSILVCGWINVAEALPKIEHWQTDEGARTYLMTTHELPIVDIIIAIEAGRMRDGALPGISALTAALLKTGTEKYGEDALLAELEDVGARLSIEAGLHYTTVRLRSHSDPLLLDKSLSLTQSVLTQATFPQDAWQREVANQKIGLTQVQESAEDLAEEKFLQTLYPNSPRGVTSTMLLSQLDQLTPDKLRQFQAQYYRANESVIVMVGDIDSKKAQAISQTISHYLQKKSVVPVSYDVETITETANASTHHISFAGPQTQIRLGQIGISRQDSDYWPLIVGNYILGSGMTSLLFSEIREKQGLSYGINSYFAPSLSRGPFQISLATANEQVPQAIESVKKVVKDFIQQGPSEEHLQLAKNYLIGSFLVNLSSNQDLANALLSIGIYELPLDYLEKYAQRIENLSSEEIQKAFARHIDLEKWITVLVGEKTTTSSTTDN